MKIQFKYKAPDYINAKKVAVIGSFNGYSESLGQMKRRGNEWGIILDIPPGEHHYKFLINKAIRLNDPGVNTVISLSGYGLWTPLFIDESGLREFESFNVQLEECSFGFSMDMEPVCKDFQVNIDSHVVVRLGFAGSSGAHAITALWYDPNGKLHSITENTLNEEDISSGQLCYLWFWMHLNNPRREYPPGAWTVKVLINGRDIYEDNFTLSNESTGIFRRCDIQA